MTDIAALAADLVAESESADGLVAELDRVEAAVTAGRSSSGF